MPIAVGLGLFYASLFVGTGASTPFIPVWFQAQGLSGAQIGIILAAPSFVRTLAAPALALWADGFRLRRTPIVLMAAGATASYALVGLLHGFWVWLVAWLAASILLGMVSPLADVIALRSARREGFNYGWPRGIGSVGYVLGNIGMGLVMLHAPPVAILVWTVSASAVTALTAWRLLPPEVVHEVGEVQAPADLLRGLGGLLRDPVFMLAILSVGVIQSSHGFYYSFSALLWHRQGVPESMVGLLWGFGVAAEVLFLWFLEPWRRRLGPERLLLVGGVAAMIRWTGLGLTSSVPLLFALQALHALTYTATFFASLRLMERLSPPKSASAAQTLNSALSGGLPLALTTVASGRLFDLIGVDGYFAMTGVAAVGVAGALLLMFKLGRQPASLSAASNNR